MTDLRKMDNECSIDRDKDDRPQPTHCPKCGKPYVYIPGILRPSQASTARTDGPERNKMIVEIFQDDGGTWRGDIKPISATNRGGDTSDDTLDGLMAKLTRMTPRVFAAPGSVPQTPNNHSDLFFGNLQYSLQTLFAKVGNPFKDLAEWGAVWEALESARKHFGVPQAEPPKEEKPWITGKL